MTAYPQVKLDLHLTDEILEFDRRWILTSHCGLQSSPTQPSGHVTFVRFAAYLVASPGYFQHHARPEHPQRLGGTCGALDITCICSTADRWQFVHSSGGVAPSVTPSYRLRANNADALGPALLAGQGLALQPQFVIWRELRAGQLESSAAWSGRCRRSR